MKRILSNAILISISFFGNAFVTYCQEGIAIPQSVIKECADVPLESRLRVNVARFTKSSTGKEGNNLDNFSSMLQNALFKVNCFRVISMEKDQGDFSDAEQNEDKTIVRPQLIVTGEVTEYYHTTESKKNPLQKKTKITAHIGFILQIKNPATRDLLFSESFNMEGSSENKEGTIKVNIPKNPFPSGTNPTFSSTSDEGIATAYSDAMEKGMAKAVTYLVDERDKMQAFVNTNGTTNPGVSSTSTKITLKEATFARLIEIENVLKTSTAVSKMEKSLKDADGFIVVSHTGSTDDLVNLLIAKLDDKLEVIGYENGKITFRAK